MLFKSTLKQRAVIAGICADNDENVVEFPFFEERDRLAFHEKNVALVLLKITDYRNRNIWDRIVFTEIGAQHFFTVGFWRIAHFIEEKY